MGQGKWYLEYSYRDSGMSGSIEKAEIPLVSGTEAEAIEEASSKWANILAEATAQWEEAKGGMAYPSASPFGGIDPSPQVVYKIALR